MVTQARPRTRRPGHRVLDGLPFTDGFRRSLVARPPLTMAGVLAAVAGALLATATLVVLGITDDPRPWAVVALGMVLMGVGWAAALLLTLFSGTDTGNGAGHRAAELIPVGTLMVLFGAPAVAVGLVAQVTRDGSSSVQSILWWPTLLVALVLLTLWIIPGLQGRPAILASALLFLTSSVAAFVAVQLGRRPAFGDPRATTASP